MSLSLSIIKKYLILFNLDIAGIAASGGSACTSGSEVGSHVLAGINAATNRKSVRFSFSGHNTKAEIDYVVEELKKMVNVKQMADVK
jgi:cysteine desulfurase